MRGFASYLLLSLCLMPLLGCSDAVERSDSDGGGANGSNGLDASAGAGDNAGDKNGAADEESHDPKCLGTPEVVPPETPWLINIGRQSYVVGPEGGTFDLTDDFAVTITIPPCAVDEPVRFTYGLTYQSTGVPGAEGASAFLSFLTIPADRAGNSGYVDFRGGDVLVTWHDSPTPERAKIWAMGLMGFEPRSTTVHGSDVQASTPINSYLDFAFGE